MKNNRNEQENPNLKVQQVHRVGTITLGISLIVFGCLFLLHIFFPALDYQTIFHVWPCIFIFLGIEVLLGSRCQRFELDKTAVFLIIVLAIFAMGMGAADFCIEVSKEYMGRI